MKKPSQGTLKASKLVQTKRGARYITHSGVKSISKCEVAVTKVNQVLGSPLVVSIRRVKLITFKVTVLDKASMLAKSRSEWGSQKPEDLTSKSHEEWVVLLQEHPLILKNTLIRNVG